VVMTVQARKLQQNIEASYEGTAGRQFWIRFHCALQEANIGLPD
jgi:hypothetical protein